MKKLTLLVTAVALALLICSCGSGNKKQNREAAADVEVVETDLTDQDEEIADDQAEATGSDWDKLLDDYEAFVDKYIATMKKASSGDLSAMTDMASMMEKAEKLSSQLAEAAGELSTAQITRMNEIVSKFSSAAMSM